MTTTPTSQDVILLEKKLLERQEKLDAKQEELDKEKAQLEKKRQEYVQKIQSLASLTTDEANKILLQNLMIKTRTRIRNPRPRTSRKPRTKRPLPSLR